MGAYRIFKQGLILVFIISFSCATLSAEVIPFDYYFGRIIGAQHLSVYYWDNKNQLNSTLDFSFKGGAADLFQYDIGDFLTWRPTKDKDRTTWRRNPLMGSFQLADGTRYYLNRFDWQDNTSFSYDKPYVRYQTNSHLWLDQSVAHLKNGSIKYLPEKSLHTYLEGRTLNNGDYLVNSSLILRINDSFYDDRCY